MNHFIWQKKNIFALLANESINARELPNFLSSNFFFLVCVESPPIFFPPQHDFSFNFGIIECSSIIQALQRAIRISRRSVFIASISFIRRV